jgi:hypothetical protein
MSGVHSRAAVIKSFSRFIIFIKSSGLLDSRAAHEGWRLAGFETFSSSIKGMLEESSLGFRSSPLNSWTSFGFKLPAWIFFPLAAQIGPVRIFRENQFQLLCSTPAFYLDLSHPCADGAKVFTPDKHVELVSRGEAIRVEFVLVLEYTIGQVAGESHIQPTRLVRHDVGPVGLHSPADYNP